MAKQRGIFKMLGTLDDVTFYKNKQGYVAKVKTTISKERISSDPAFARMRENGRDFGRAGTAGKTLRRAFQSILLGSDGLMVSRLHKLLIKCAQADTTHGRGEKTAQDGDLTFLKNFEFNAEGPLSSTLKTTVTTTLNRTTGALTINVPSFVPTTSLSVPAGATHYKLVVGGSAVDFTAHESTTDTDETGYLPIDNSAAAAVSLALSLPAGVTLPVFQVVGISFYLDDNGTKYPLNNGAFNAMSIVDVDL